MFRLLLTVVWRRAWATDHWPLQCGDETGCVWTYVGGLPQHPQPPFYTKQPFSTYWCNWRIHLSGTVERERRNCYQFALTDRHMIFSVGTRSVYTDGLRSLLYTMPYAPISWEQTPLSRHGLIPSLQQSGFLTKHSINIKGRDKSAAVYFQVVDWPMEAGRNEEELTVSESGGTRRRQTITYDLLDYYDPATQTSSMACTRIYAQRRWTWWSRDCSLPKVCILLSW